MIDYFIGAELTDERKKNSKILLKTFLPMTEKDTTPSETKGVVILEYENDYYHGAVHYDYKVCYFNGDSLHEIELDKTLPFFYEYDRAIGIYLDLVMWHLEGCQ